MGRYDKGSQAMSQAELERLARAKACGKHTWQEIADWLGTTAWGAKNQYRRYAKKRRYDAGPCPLCAEAAVAAGAVADPGGQPKWEESGNYAEATATGPRIKSLDALLDTVKPDLDVWQVLNWGAKCWEMGAKIKEGHLEWDQGRIDGYLNYKGIGSEDLWSVWAKFIRREPIAVKPVLRPIECSVTYPLILLQETGGSQLGLILPDVQMGYSRDIRTGRLAPFHDRRALDLTVRLAARLQPAVIVILGDFLDLTMWTDKFIRSPEFYFTTQPAILEGHWYLRRLREACPGARIVLLQGNHEERVDKMLSVHLIEAYDLKAADELTLPPALSIPKLLALHRLGIEWVDDYPDGEVWIGSLRAVHGDRVSSVPGGSARAIVDNTDQDTVFGHVHRLEQVSRRVRTRNGYRTIKSYSAGCLCHLDGRVPGSKAGDNWQQGIGIVEYTPTAYTMSLVEITGGVCVWQGTNEGDDYTDDLRRAWPEWAW